MWYKWVNLFPLLVIQIPLPKNRFPASVEVIWNYAPNKRTGNICQTDLRLVPFYLLISRENSRCARQGFLNKLDMNSIWLFSFELWCNHCLNVKFIAMLWHYWDEHCFNHLVKECRLLVGVCIEGDLETVHIFKGFTLLLLDSLGTIMFNKLLFVITFL